MATEKDISTFEHKEVTALRTSNGIVLVPQPSDDPKDPLNVSDILGVQISSCRSPPNMLLDSQDIFLEFLNMSFESFDMSHDSGFFILWGTIANNYSANIQWPMSKKIRTLGIISFASFVGLAQQLANQAGFFPQAVLYHREPVELSYSVNPNVPFPLYPDLMMSRSVRQLQGRLSVRFFGLLCRNTSVAALSSSGERLHASRAISGPHA
jgi:hypothetical protein